MATYEEGLRDALHKNAMLKDLIIAAFIAETGCLPSECCLIEQRSGNRVTWTIQKAANNSHKEVDTPSSPE